jgi:hypothetical protein
MCRMSNPRRTSLPAGRCAAWNATPEILAQHWLSGRPKGKHRGLFFIRLAQSLKSISGHLRGSRGNALQTPHLVDATAEPNA